MKHPSKGMTLVELAVVVLIICGLAITSIPAFFFLRDYSREKKMRNLVAHMQSDLEATHAQNLVNQNASEIYLPYPLTLDNNPKNSLCTQCFDHILKKGLESDLWFKKDVTTYLFFKRGYHENKKGLPSLASPGQAEGQGNFQINYNPQDGKIVINLIR